jgi:hypothetical protein
MAGSLPRARDGRRRTACLATRGRRRPLRAVACTPSLLELSPALTRRRPPHAPLPRAVMPTRVNTEREKRKAMSETATACARGRFDSAAAMTTPTSGVFHPHRRRASSSGHWRPNPAAPVLSDGGAVEDLVSAASSLSTPLLRLAPAGCARAQRR